MINRQTAAAGMQSVDWLQNLCQTVVSDVIRLSPVLMFADEPASIVSS
jgi:hypothetical protein